MADADNDGVCNGARRGDSATGTTTTATPLVDEGGVCPGGDGVCAQDAGACLTLADATALGWLSIVSNSGTGAIVGLRNTGSRPVCIDEQAMFTAPSSQAFFVDAAVLGAQIPAGGTYNLYYGSWTSPNGYYQPYLGSPAWWCLEFGQHTGANAPYDVVGEAAPVVLTGFAAPGLSSRNAWAGTYGVQANYDVWNYQATHPVFTIGKTAQDAGSVVDVQLAIRNLGAASGSATITDYAPAGWSVSNLPAGFVATPQGDGSTRIDGSVTIAGTYNSYNPLASWLSYRLTSSSGTDAGRLALGRASATYFDLAATRTSTSLAASVFTVDVDGNGYVDCR